MTTTSCTIDVHRSIGAWRDRRRFGALVLGLLAAPVIAASDDPFGAPPKGASPNCGPEERYAFQQTISSKADFVSFLMSRGADIRDRFGNNWVQLDNFRSGTEGKDFAAVRAAPVDWAGVANAVKTETRNGRTHYVIDFTPAGCIGQHFTLKMTTDGHVSVYGCCGV
jgi:hypothetical protein